MKRIIFAAICTLLAATYVSAQGVNFLDNQPFAEALKQAKEQNKKVFLDCYTQWCGPCRMMTNEIFPQKVCGDYFNADFVCLKVDMEKGEGPELHKRFKVAAFPTFIVFDSDGKEINRIVGGERDAAKFVQEVKNGMGEGSLSALHARFDEGERSDEFLIKYINALGVAYERDRCTEVATILLNGKTEELLHNKDLYEVFVRYNRGANNPTFLYVWQHRSEFTTKYDRNMLEHTLANTWMNHPRTYVQMNPDGIGSYDAEGMAAYAKLMKDNDVPNRDEISLLTNINARAALRQWKQFMKQCTKYRKAYGDNDNYIANWCINIAKNCSDAKLRAKALSWAKERKQAVEETEAKRQRDLKPGEMRAMSMVNFSKTYEKIIAEF